MTRRPFAHLIDSESEYSYRVRACISKTVRCRIISRSTYNLPFRVVGGCSSRLAMAVSTAQAQHAVYIYISI